VFDKNEVQGLDLLEKPVDSSALSTTPTVTNSAANSTTMEKEKPPAEDPKWNGELMLNKKLMC
jgi:hypothetical protein